jgi:hypothetical protein
VVCRHSIFRSVCCSPSRSLVRSAGPQRIPTFQRAHAEDNALYRARHVELTRESRIILIPKAGMAELADALDSKASDLLHK